FLLGAAVVHFKLPPSDYLHEAFIGARAWAEQRSELAETSGPAETPVSQDVHDPDRAFNGFTLYTTNVGSQAGLLDMGGEGGPRGGGGEVVHRWSAPFGRVWPRPPHVREPVEDAKIYFFACHLYPNGDLLAVFHGTGDTPYGYGLAKLDRDSNVLWTYSANVHHTVDVGEDGTIYVLTQQIIREAPAGLEFIGTPALVDSLVLLSPEGKELKAIPLLEAFRDSPYALLLPSRRPDAAAAAWDVLHANSVEVLTRRLAPHHPLFRAGQVL